MSDPSENRPKHDAIEEHEGLDAETIADDIKELFEPDNEQQIPPPSPDAPPP
jgi:hypothetical protein